MTIFVILITINTFHLIHPHNYNTISNIYPTIHHNITKFVFFSLLKYCLGVRNYLQFLELFFKI